MYFGDDEADIVSLEVIVLSRACGGSGFGCYGAGQSDILIWLDVTPLFFVGE